MYIYMYTYVNIIYTTSHKVMNHDIDHLSPYRLSLYRLDQQNFCLQRRLLVVPIALAGAAVPLEVASEQGKDQYQLGLKTSRLYIQIVALFNASKSI